MGIMKTSSKAKRGDSRAATNMGFTGDGSFQYIPYGMNDTNVKDLSLTEEPPQSPKSPAPLEISVLSHLVAGKKRVMASKAKPRHRPTLQQADQQPNGLVLGLGRSLGPMSAEALEWSEADYGVAELVDVCPPGTDDWPLLVKVTSTEGCSGADIGSWQTVGQVGLGG